MTWNARLLCTGIALVVLLALASLMLGPVALGPGTVVRALFGATDPIARTIVTEIRLPRTLLALAIGGSLGMSGAALQGFLRNPLAEPALLGVSGAAALGAVAALYSTAAAGFALAMPLAAVVGAFVAIGILLLLVGRSAGPLTLILAGIAVGSFTGAAVSLSLNLAPNPFAALEVTFWLLGSLEDRGMNHVLLAIPPIVAGAALLAFDRRALEALTLGDDIATSLGFRLSWVRLRLLAGIGLGVGAAVAVSGTIGFVGLVVPHLLRPLVAGRPGSLLLPSALGGAALLITADIAVRLIPSMEPVKLGVLTAAIGAPFFLHLIWRTRRQFA